MLLSNGGEVESVGDVQRVTRNDRPIAGGTEISCGEQDASSATLGAVAAQEGARNGGRGVDGKRCWGRAVGLHRRVGSGGGTERRGRARRLAVAGVLSPACVRCHRVACCVRSAGAGASHEANVPCRSICTALEILGVHVLQADVHNQVVFFGGPLQVAVLVKALNAEYAAGLGCVSGPASAGHCAQYRVTRRCFIVCHGKAPYAMRMIADVFDAAGNCTVNAVVEVLSAPKSKTHTAGSPPPV